MKYILFEKSAVELLINENGLQSVDFDLGKRFIDFLKTGKGNIDLVGIISKVIEKSSNEVDGIVICGKKHEKCFIVFDLEQCELFNGISDSDLLSVLQKTFRFCVRFWNRQAFTNCEKIINKNKAVIFPFPFSTGTAFRIVLERNPNDKRLFNRGIEHSILAYKYGIDGASSGVEETPDLNNYRKSGEKFIEILPELVRELNNKDDTNDDLDDGKAIHFFEAQSFIIHSEFKYLNYEKQISNLTVSQKEIVDCPDLDSPVRIEGPAGTGKSAALILRAVRIFTEFKNTGKHITIAIITHSKSTELAARQMVTKLLPDLKWQLKDNQQNIIITTLQEYCIKYININETQIIDLDAAEAKQYQLLLIKDAFDKIKNQTFNTFKCLMSNEAIAFFEQEEESRIILMLQHEFSIRIKGMAESDLERYKKMVPLVNGIPIKNEIDKDFIFRIFKEYQSFLEGQSVYDTDDITLEALARLNAPLWRRARIKDGIDYLIVDEMHLFNLNEQQIFHYLTKDGEQKTIPICFALDYGQVIGERGDFRDNYIEKTISRGQKLKEKLTTVFRSSQQIAELCASITASGALLFENFINPYKSWGSSFTAREEALCEIPKLIMYENDDFMVQSLEEHIKVFVNKYKCKLSEIAVIFFDEDILKKYFEKNIGRYDVNYVNGRIIVNEDSSAVICSLPEFINGLEFKCVILFGVDEGRVPLNGVRDISSNFLRYSALNKLYLACSRAQYSVLILGAKTHGISSCLRHSIDNQTIQLHSQEE